MKNKIMLTALATIGLLAFTSIFGFAQINTARSNATASTTDFHDPQNLGLTVNSDGGENGVFVAPNGLSLYFSGNRAGGEGLGDIWVSQRPMLTSAWGPPQNLGTVINTGNVENRPRLSLDGLTMFFNSNREGSQDIFISTRTNPNDDFSWTTPVNLGVNINTPDGSESTPAYFEDPTTGIATLYFSSDREGGQGDFDIYQSTRNANGTFNPAINCAFLNSVARDFMPFPSRDGLEIYLVSDNGGLGGLDIWVATRGSIYARWKRPVNVETLNSENDESDPALSPDSSVLYFGSSREGGSGGSDLYTATRLCTSRK
ncbi:MAG: hypothetical protein ACKVRN_04475 [Pyrinomonadaceae bacterium]